jgi:hypothetical protein
MYQNNNFLNIISFYIAINFSTSDSTCFGSLKTVHRSAGTFSNAFIYLSGHVGKHSGV